MQMTHPASQIQHWPSGCPETHLEHTVSLVGPGRVRLKPMITHVLNGLEAVPRGLREHGEQGNLSGH